MRLIRFNHSERVNIFILEVIGRCFLSFIDKIGSIPDHSPQLGHVDTITDLVKVERVCSRRSGAICLILVAASA